MRRSKEWAVARAMSQATPEQKRSRGEAFKAAWQQYELTSGSIQKFAEKCRDNCWIGDHLGSHDTQTTSLRAFEAVRMYAFGTKGRPQFKGVGQLYSVEGKEDAVIIHRIEAGQHVVKWRGLTMPLLLDARDKSGWQRAALLCRTKYVRILRRSVRGQERWYAQFILEGTPPRKARNKTGEGIVCADIGPSTIAVVAVNEIGEPTTAFLEPLCPLVERPDRKIRQIERGMDRSRRETNREHFTSNGTIRPMPEVVKARKEKIKKAITEATTSATTTPAATAQASLRRDWVRSKRYQRRAVHKADLERRLAAERKRAHGELANRMLALGNVIQVEDVSYKAWQKNFGRSVGRCAPGMLITRLEQKAVSVGASVERFSTYETRLSQYDHKSGSYKKKALSERWHIFNDGTRVQRDLYSAWLGTAVRKSGAGKDERHDLDATQLTNWAAAEPLLRQAASRALTQSTSGVRLSGLHGLTHADHTNDLCRQSGSPVIGCVRSSPRVNSNARGQDEDSWASQHEESRVSIRPEPQVFRHGEVQERN